MSSLKKKFEEAAREKLDIEDAYSKITKKLSEKDLKQWSEEERQAMEFRGPALDIYQTNTIKGEFCISF